MKTKKTLKLLDHDIQRKKRAAWKTTFVSQYYYWKKGADFVKYAEQMIAKDIRVNNEFYVCPVFNEAFEDDLKIKLFEINKMWGLGTQEDLNNFLNFYKF